MRWGLVFVFLVGVAVAGCGGGVTNSGGLHYTRQGLEQPQPLDRPPDNPYSRSDNK